MEVQVAFIGQEKGDTGLVGLFATFEWGVYREV